MCYRYHYLFNDKNILRLKMKDAFSERPKGRLKDAVAITYLLKLTVLFSLVVACTV